MPVQNIRRRLAVATVTLAVTATLGACASTDDEASGADDTGATSTPPPTPDAQPTSSDPADPSEAPTPTPTEPAGPTLAVTVEGDDVAPNAEEISIGVGEPLLLTFVSDRPGELHVHSKPEQYVQFEAGESQQELVIETPGTVEIEDHDTGAVVAVVEAS